MPKRTNKRGRTAQVRRDPEYLDDMIFGEGLPAADAYGANHAPRFEAGKEAELFAAAATCIEASFARLGGLPLLAALGAIQRVSALAPPPQSVDTATIELAQAEMLRRAAVGALPEPSDVDALVGVLETRKHLFLAQTTKQSGDPKGDILARRRMQTLHVRHTSYPRHASRIAQRIGFELGEFGKEVLGMPFGIAVKLAEAAALGAASRIDSSGAAEAILAWLANGKGAFDETWLEAFRIDVDVLVAAMGLPRPAILGLLDRLSLAPGDLADAVPEHLPLANPVWRRPFVREGEHHYLFSPETLFASSFDIMAEIADAASASGAQKLGDARGPALEGLLGEALAEILPHAEILTGAHWHDSADGKRRETDAIAILDGILLIFEAKGDALTAPARRGSADWFKAFDDIVVGAASQASRLESVLRDLSDPHIRFETAKGPRTIPKKAIRHIVRFGISLERVTMMSFGLDFMLAERIRRTGAEPMPIFTIGDLWQVRELLPSEGHRLHFFLRRAELEEDGAFIGDELDLLALYLRTGFIRLGGSAGGQTTLNIYGLSDFLRHYQQGSAHHDPAVRPPRRTTLLWDRLIGEKELKRPPLWTDLVYDMLNIPLESQRAFAEDMNIMRRCVRRAPKGTLDEVHMQAPWQLRPSRFVGLVAGRMSDAERLARARARFAAYESAWPDERLFIFMLDAGSKRSEPTLPYYRGITWDRRHVVETMEGRGVASGLSMSLGDAVPEK